MAHAIERVTNEQVLAALRGMGFDPGPVDMSGAQNSTWKLRVLPLLRGVIPAGQYPEDIFNRAITAAKDIVAIPPDASTFDKLTRTFQAYGVSGEQFTRIMDEAKRIRRTTPGIKASDIQFNEQDFLQAARGVLGDVPMVAEAGRFAGITLPPGGVGTPPPAPGAASAPNFSGVGNADAMPGTAKPTTPSPPGAPAAPGVRGSPGAGSAAGAGGGASGSVPGPATWSDDEIKNFIRSNFGANAYFIDIPEVWEALRGVVKGGKGINGLQPALEGTSFWKQNTSSARNWFARAKADPAQTAADIAQQSQALAAMAQNAGLTIDPGRLSQIAESSLRYGWTNTDIQRALAAEWHYDPTTKNQAAAVTAMKQTARNWLVPLSDQAIQTWGQGLISGTTTNEQFTQYLRDNAKSLFPQLSGMIDAHAGDPKFSIDTFVDPYRTQAANLLGVQPDQVDFADPKWRRPLDTIDPKTGERRIMTLSEWQSTLKTDAQYGYDKTQNGVNEALTLAQSLTKSMGF